MRDALRKDILSYWEKRRVIYNLLLIPPASFGWNLSADLTYSIDDRFPARLDDPFVIRSALLLLLMANVCYSMAYMLEIALMSEKKKAFWPRPGRTLVLVVGCAIGMLLAAANASHLQTSARGDWRPVDPSPTLAP